MDPELRTIDQMGAAGVAGVGAASTGGRTDLVFYDGDCGLCHATVRFLLRKDPGGVLFRFAPIGGETWKRQFPPAERGELPDSIIVRTAEGERLLRSAAVAHLLRRLDGFWRMSGRVLAVIPRPLGDGAYAGIARLRRLLRPRPADWCPMPKGPERDRFMP